MGGSRRHHEVHGGIRQEPWRGAESGRAGQIKVNDGLTGAALVALAVAILWHVQGYPAMPGQRFGPAWFPGVIAAGLGVCGLLLVVAGMRQRGPWLALPDWISRRRPALGVAAVVGGLVVYILGADTFGFHITGIALLFVWTRLLGATWRTAAVVSVLATLAIHLAFYRALRIPLPWGLLEPYAF
ncbi:MAG TPA: tripartite tricarboxylate transporter TctB family protein [Burkholderiales bacterium]|nr:tripartite tricarboxylate transporter TctB family protein [Burkholderiales bacterium]